VVGWRHEKGTVGCIHIKIDTSIPAQVNLMMAVDVHMNDLTKLLPDALEIEWAKYVEQGLQGMPSEPPWVRDALGKAISAHFGAPPTPPQPTTRTSRPRVGFRVQNQDNVSTYTHAPFRKGTMGAYSGGGAWC